MLDTNKILRQYPELSIFINKEFKEAFKQHENNLALKPGIEGTIHSVADFYKSLIASEVNFAITYATIATLKTIIQKQPTVETLQKL